MYASSSLSLLTAALAGALGSLPVLAGGDVGAAGDAPALHAATRKGTTATRPANRFRA
jgi:hypothetical protein